MDPSEYKVHRNLSPEGRWTLTRGMMILFGQGHRERGGGARQGPADPVAGALVDRLKETKWILYAVTSLRFDETMTSSRPEGRDAPREREERMLSSHRFWIWCPSSSSSYLVPTHAFPAFSLAVGP